MQNEWAQLNPEQPDAVLRLLGREKLRIMEFLLQKRMTASMLCRGLEDLPKERIAEELEQLLSLGLVCREAGYFALTELGQEARPVFEALTAYGRLCRRAYELGLIPPVTMPEKPEEKQESREQESREDEKTAARTMERHRWRKRGSSFLFSNPHTGYEDWYFYGREDSQNGTYTLCLIAEEEFTELWKDMEAGGEPHDTEIRPQMKLERSKAELLPEQEAFYIAVEDALIKRALGEGN